MRVQVTACTGQASGDRRMLHQYYALRARVFADRLKWDVNVADGQERDEYDLLQPVYILAVADDQTVVGGARLLPATGPTMLTQTFPYLLEEGRVLVPHGMIESSRFCGRWRTAFPQLQP